MLEIVSEESREWNTRIQKNQDGNSIFYFVEVTDAGSHGLELPFLQKESKNKSVCTNAMTGLLRALDTPGDELLIKADTIYMVVQTLPWSSYPSG